METQIISHDMLLILVVFVFMIVIFGLFVIVVSNINRRPQYNRRRTDDDGMGYGPEEIGPGAYIFVVFMAFSILFFGIVLVLF